MNSRHELVSCDNCNKTNFEGIRFKCLICYDYDLCERCHTNGATTERHLSSHPMQCILTRSETDMLYRGEQSLIQDAFTCPHCGNYGFKSNELVQHVIEYHAGEALSVICPICIVTPSNDPNSMVQDLAVHMTSEHTQQNSRRNTIRELRRMIYPSRGTSRNRGRGSSTIRDVPFMHFVSDPADGEHLTSGMEDSLTELLNQLSNQPSRRLNQSNRNQTSQQQNKEEKQHPIPRRLLLDNLSDEEEQVSDELKRQKCHFFQDLLLSTLTDKKLTMKVTGLNCSSSSSCSSSGLPSDKHSKSTSDSKSEKKKNKEDNNNDSHLSSDNEGSV